MIATRAYVDAMVAESHRRATLWPIMYLRHASDARLAELWKALDPEQHFMSDVPEALRLIQRCLRTVPE